MSCINKIDGQKFYTLYEISVDDLFNTKIASLGTRRAKCRAIIRTDSLTNNYLKAKLVPDSRGIKYSIRGSNIIKYLVNKEDNGNRKN